MDIEDLDKYILEQAKIEVEYTRSWPNKLLAFYVAINFGVAGSLLTLATREKPVHVPPCGNILITLVALAFFVWTVTLLIRNHLSYLRHRNLQIKFQIDHSEEINKRKYEPPEDWFQLNEISIFKCRRLGWVFYFFTTVLVTALTIMAIWVAGGIYEP